VEEVKDDLIDRGIDLDQLEELREKCQTIAKLKIEQEKLYQKRFETRQEAPV
jgi:DNA-binding protein H-NS